MVVVGDPAAVQVAHVCTELAGVAACISFRRRIAANRRLTELHLFFFFSWLFSGRCGSAEILMDTALSRIPGHHTTAREHQFCGEKLKH